MSWSAPGSVPGVVQAEIINTEGLRSELLVVLGVVFIGIAVIAAVKYGSKGSLRDLGAVVVGVLFVFLIVGLGALVTTDAGQQLVSAIFNLG
ncbi:MAG: hypothetical protein ACRCYX_03890 [Dermatophilaceae bacterium]